MRSTASPYRPHAPAASRIASTTSSVSSRPAGANRLNSPQASRLRVSFRVFFFAFATADVALASAPAM